MPSTTWQNLRREFAAYLGYSEIIGKDGEAWTTTSTIGASTTITSTELRDYGMDDYLGAGSGDDSIQNYWVQILGSNNSNVVRRIKLYDASAGTITVTGTNLSAESGNVDFEIHRYSPTLLRSLLNEARLAARDVLYAPVERTVMTAQAITKYEIPSTIFEKPVSIYLEDGVQSDYANNILTDGGFETWTNSTTLTNWSGTNLDVTQEQETTSPKNYAVLRDTYSARCTSQASSTGTLLQTISSPDTYSGQRIGMAIWVYCLTASIVSTQLTINSTINLGTAADGGLHRGTGWELLTHYENMPVTVSSLTVGISVVSGATDNTEFYVDEANVHVGPVQEPDRGGLVLRNWTYHPMIEDSTRRSYIDFPYLLPDNQLLRISGKSELSSVSAEADTMEISSPQTQILFAYGAEELYRRLLQSSPDMDEQYMRRRLTQIRNHKAELIESHGTPVAPRALKIPDGGV